MNIQSAITNGAKILESKFISSAYLDSEILMTKAMNRNKKYLLLNAQKKIGEKNLNFFQKLIAERCKGKPVSYLTNKKFFWNSEFYVTEDTLIPRPDSELIVENVLNLTKNKTGLSILDIGVGSGCILLSILQKRRDFYGTGVDISKNCLKISNKNAINLNVNSRLKLYNSSVDKFALGKYDLIISNPPYIKKYILKYLDKGIAKFEPKLALDGGIDGLSVIGKVIEKSSKLIKKNGKFILEIGFDQKNKVIKLLNKKGFYINSALRDLGNNDRCIICTKI